MASEGLTDRETVPEGGQSGDLGGGSPTPLAGPVEANTRPFAPKVWLWTLAAAGDARDLQVPFLPSSKGTKLILGKSDVGRQRLKLCKNSSKSPESPESLQFYCRIN